MSVFALHWGFEAAQKHPFLVPVWPECAGFSLGWACLLSPWPAPAARQLVLAGTLTRNLLVVQAL